MSAFLPSLPAAQLAAALLASVLLLALAITRLRSTRLGRYSAWSLAALAVAAADRSMAGAPAGFRMLILIVALFLAMKAAVSVEATAADGTRLPTLRWLAFATLWPGMRPSLFASLESREGAAALMARGLLPAALGAGLIASAPFIATASGSRAWASLALLPGLSLLVHFGVFNVVAGLWRLAGADVGPLFRAPLLAASLGEFWSRRWNIAFSEMTAATVYRPLSRAAGRRAGLLAAFFCSGLFHEVAISLPVGAGYGGPLAYFALQGILLAWRPHSGRALVWAAVVLPLPLLFHPAFMRAVVWPLLGAP